MPLTLDALNRMEAAGFEAVLGQVFEHSPWVAAQAAAARPFASADALHAAMMAAVAAAPRERQLGLLRAHPELAGREAVEGGLTPDSSTEQGRLGFTALPRDEFERIARINRAYREKHGFPAIVALALHRHRDTVIEAMQARAANDTETEIATALAQVGHITRARLAKLLSA